MGIDLTALGAQDMFAAVVACIALALWTLLLLLAYGIWFASTRIYMAIKKLLS